MGTKKLYRNMRLFTPVDGGHPLAGKEQANVKEIKKAAMLVSGGIIEKIGEEEEILKNVCPLRGRDRKGLRRGLRHPRLRRPAHAHVLREAPRGRVRDAPRGTSLP